MPACVWAVAWCLTWQPICCWESRQRPSRCLWSFPLRLQLASCWLGPACALCGGGAGCMPRLSASWRGRSCPRVGRSGRYVLRGHWIIGLRAVSSSLCTAIRPSMTVRTPIPAMRMRAKSVWVRCGCRVIASLAPVRMYVLSVEFRALRTMRMGARACFEASFEK